MNPNLEKLIELDRAEREIARLRQEIAALPARVTAIERRLAASKAQVESARNSIRETEGQRRKLEGEIQAYQQKISKYREQSLEVKTNEQYKALLHEIGFAEQAIRGSEDKILEGMIEIETQEKLLRTAERELKEETAEIEKEKEQARAVTATDEKELAKWTGESQQLRAEIEPDLLRHFDRVLKLRGSGIAEARDHKCTACQVMLRPQTDNDVRTTEQIVTCDSCQRLLYYAGPAAAPEPAEAAREAPATH